MSSIESRVAALERGLEPAVCGHAQVVRVVRPGDPEPVPPCSRCPPPILVVDPYVPLPEAEQSRPGRTEQQPPVPAPAPARTAPEPALERPAYIAGAPPPAGGLVAAALRDHLARRPAPARRERAWGQDDPEVNRGG